MGNDDYIHPRAYRASNRRKVTGGHPGGLKVSIPVQVYEELEIKAGDFLEWIVEENYLRVNIIKAKEGGG